MLERASTCLETGARISLRCARRPNTSRRRLHAAFWAYGALDLDLPSLTFDTNLCRKSKDKRTSQLEGCEDQSNQEEEAVSAKTTSTNEPPLLDFLYPPQALAWLCRTAASPPYEDWEKRNARRLPKGFVHASRNYSSLVVNRHARRQSERETKGENTNDSWLWSTDYQSSPTSSGTPSEQSQTPQHPASALPVYPGNGITQTQQQRTQSQGSQQASETVEHLTDHGPDVRVGIKSAPLESIKTLFPPEGVDAVIRLSVFLRRADERLRTKTSRYQHHYLRAAWDAYRGMGLHQQTDQAIVERLLAFFSKYHDSASDTQSIELFDTIAVSQRTISMYSSAISLYLRCGLVGFAEQALTEAQSRFSDTTRLSMTYIVSALTVGRLDIAYRRYHELAQHVRSSRLERLLRKGLSPIATLHPLAFALGKELRTQRRARTANASYQRFSGIVIQTAVMKDLLTSYANPRLPQKPMRDGQNRYLIRLILEYCSRDQATRLVKDLLLAIIRPSSTVSFEKAGGIAKVLLLAWYPRAIQYAAQYAANRNSISPRTDRHRSAASRDILSRSMEPMLRDVHPDKTCVEKYRTYIFLLFLRKTLQERQPLRPDAIIHGHFDIEELVSKWKESSRRDMISIKGCIYMLRYYANRGDRERVRYWAQHYRQRLPLWMRYGITNRYLQSEILVHANLGDVDKAQQAFDRLRAETKTAGYALTLEYWNALMCAYTWANDMTGAYELLDKMIREPGLKPNEHTLHPLLDQFARRGDTTSVANLLARYQHITGMQPKVLAHSSVARAFIAAHNDTAVTHHVYHVIMHLIRRTRGRAGLTQPLNLLLQASINMESRLAKIIYRSMKLRRVPLEAATYAVLSRNLAFRKDITLRKSINLALSTEHFEAVMTALLIRSDSEAALRVYRVLNYLQVRTSFTTEALYMTAHSFAKPLGDNGFLNAANIVGASLEKQAKALDGDSPPLYTMGSKGHGTLVRLCAYLLQTHGNFDGADAVKQLLQKYLPVKSLSDSDVLGLPPPVIISLMQVYTDAGDRDGVERCWTLAQATYEHDRALHLAQGRYHASGAAVRHFDLQRLLLPLKYALKSAIPAIEGTESPRGVSAVALADLTNPPHHSENPFCTQVTSSQYWLSIALKYQVAMLVQHNEIDRVLDTLEHYLANGHVFNEKTCAEVARQCLKTKPPLLKLSIGLVQRLLQGGFRDWDKPGIIEMLRETYMQRHMDETLGMSHTTIQTSWMPYVGLLDELSETGPEVMSLLRNEHTRRRTSVPHLNLSSSKDGRPQMHDKRIRTYYVGELS